MFFGHYRVSFGIKSIDRKIPLWVLLIAGQLMDVLWSPLVIIGIEKVRIVPGFTASNPLDLYYMPYSHSLIAAIGWSGISFIAYQLFSQSSSRQSALLVALAVFSHWLLDLLVHIPDLPLYNDSYKVGLGLWNYPVVAYPLEFVLLFVGIFLYLRSTVAKSALGKYGMLIFVGIKIVVDSILFLFFVPAIKSSLFSALLILTSHTIFAGVAYWLEETRVDRSGIGIERFPKGDATRTN
jgi:hypothetical protein